MIDRESSPLFRGAILLPNEEEDALHAGVEKVGGVRKQFRGFFGHGFAGASYPSEPSDRRCIRSVVLP